MSKLNKNEIIEIVSERGHLSKRDAKVAVDLTFELIENALVNGEEVNITNFGVFSPLTREARIGTNPKDHKQITIPETHSVSFKVAKSVKNKMN